MSDIKDMKKIEAPSLSAADYGTDISAQFENIDHNFSILANRDFVKGDTGDGLITEFYPLTILKDDMYYLTETGRDVILAMAKDMLSQGEYDGCESILSDLVYPTPFNKDVNLSIYNLEAYVNSLVPTIIGVKQFSFVDSLKDTSLGFTVVKKVSNDCVGETPISVVNYIIFKDLRYNNEYLSDVTIDNEFYRDRAVDMSCVVYGEVVDGKICCSIRHDIPSLYYNRDVKAFCWKFGGVETGIIAQGPAGQDGQIKGGMHTAYVDLSKKNEDGNYINTYTNQGKTYDIYDDIITAWNNNSESVVTQSLQGIALTSYIQYINGAGEEVDTDETSWTEFNAGDIVIVNVSKDTAPKQYTFFTSVTAVNENPAVSGHFIEVILTSKSLVKTNVEEDLVERTLTNSSPDATSGLVGLHVPYDRTSYDKRQTTRHMIWSSLNGNDKYQKSKNGTETITPQLNIAALTGFGVDTEESGFPLSYDVQSNAVANIMYDTVKFGRDSDNQLVINRNGIIGYGESLSISSKECIIACGDEQVVIANSGSTSINNELAAASVVSYGSIKGNEITANTSMSSPQVNTQEVLVTTDLSSPVSAESSYITLSSSNDSNSIFSSGALNISTSPTLTQLGAVTIFSGLRAIGNNYRCATFLGGKLTLSSAAVGDGILNCGTVKCDRIISPSGEGGTITCSSTFSCSSLEGVNTLELTGDLTVPGDLTANGSISAPTIDTPNIKTSTIISNISKNEDENDENGQICFERVPNDGSVESQGTKQVVKIQTTEQVYTPGTAVSDTSDETLLPSISGWDDDVLINGVYGGIPIGTMAVCHHIDKGKTDVPKHWLLFDGTNYYQKDHPVQYEALLRARWEEATDSDGNSYITAPDIAPNYREIEIVTNNKTNIEVQRLYHLYYMMKYE